MTIGSNWTIGMEVVFIGWPGDAQQGPPVVDAGTPKQNGIYVIRRTVLRADGQIFTTPSGFTYAQDGDSVYLDVGLGCLMLAEGFRPVQKRKTDISCFERLLITKSTKELVQ